MAGLILADRVKETSVTEGLGPFTLGGAVLGFRTFASVCVNGSVIHYCIVDRNSGVFEIGAGTWGTGGIITRSEVLASSTGSAIDFQAGTKDVMMVVPARGAVSLRESYFPREQTEEFEISEAQIRTLFSAPITLLPAQVGFAHYIQGGSIFREAGTAYTLNGSTLLQFVVNAGTYLQFAASIFSGVGPYAQVGVQPAFTTFSIIANGQDNSNKPLTLQMNNADLTGGTGRLWARILWRTFPNTRLLVPA